MTTSEAACAGPPYTTAGEMAARPRPQTTATQAIAVAMAADTGPVSVESASAAMLTASAGSTTSSGSQPPPGRNIAAAIVGASAVAMTATERTKNSQMPETGAAVARSAAGSSRGWKAAATPASGSSGASTRNGSS